MDRYYLMSKLQDKLNALPTDSLRGIRRGVEKEGLRVQPTGGLALTPHPKALGSALTHPLITTDYSESQLELITGAHLGVQQCMDELTEVHQFVHHTLKDGVPRVCTAWAWVTATAGACRPFRASTTTGRCPA